uniref:TGB1 n=1 Tax=Potato latent virus TaxID=138982 RepID=A0A346KIA5_9VIRU|nr:triple gene block protein 1 [Potato latent virus]QPD01718.1 TGB1 [Potato latent virus]WIW79788.1 triple gene block protein 1 [Potato latent virus]
MDVLVNKALEFGFKRLSSVLKSPIVFHSVPGAGKTTLIRALLNSDSRFEGWTLAEGDKPNLEGVVIRKYVGGEVGPFALLDEYCVEPEIAGKFYAVFGDPLQVNNIGFLRASWIKVETHRFGKATAQLLNQFGFEVSSSKADILVIADIFVGEPEGTVVYFEEEVGCLLKRHSLEAVHIDLVRGDSFPVVTFVTSENCMILDKVRSFNCLTRHSEKLIILCPNATYSPT